VFGLDVDCHLTPRIEGHLRAAVSVAFSLEADF